MMQTRVGVNKNLWSRRQSGLYAPKRMNFPLDGLQLYVPLGHPELSGSTIVSKDLNAHSCAVVGAVHNPPLSRFFDGVDDNIKVAYNAAMDSADGTVEIWFSPNDSVSGADLNDHFYGRNNNQTDYLVIALAPDWGSVSRGCLGVQRKTGGTAYYVESDATAWIGGIWYHMAVIWGSSGMKLYVDGVLQTDTDADTGSWTHNSEDLYVGAILWEGSIVVPFKGLIGEVRQYSRILSGYEIKHNYLSTRWRYQ